jgi:CheY-like chemotaxis protein
VLVADDTELNRILVKDYLAGTDLNIIEAADGAEAIEQTKKHRPALVILDLNMPGTSGYDAAKQLKSDKTTLDIPVIALSAENPEESMSDLKKSGFDGYLSKPLSRKMLIGELAKFLKTEEFAENDQSNSWNGDDYIQSLDALGNDEKQRFLEIYDRIENEYMTKWKKVSSSAVIRDIKAFGEKIAELGKSNKIEPLYVYGRKLTTEADNFEFDKFPNTLNEFKELIEKMKELSE